MNILNVHYDNLSLPEAIEAMASGTICVLNRIDSFVQLTNNGQWGALTNFENHEESADCLFKALSMSPAEYSARSDSIRAYAKALIPR